MKYWFVTFGLPQVDFGKEPKNDKAYSQHLMYVFAAETESDLFPIKTAWQAKKMLTGEMAEHCGVILDHDQISESDYKDLKGDGDGIVGFYDIP